MSKPKSPKSSTPPALAPPVQTPSEVVGEAQSAGSDQGRRLRKRTGRRSTRIPQLTSSANASPQAGLKATLAGTSA